MTRTDYVKLLHGPYVTPRFKLGDVVIDEARGIEVVIVGIRDGRIPWPVGKPKGGRAKAPIVYEYLERALRVESNAAICYWWGVTPQTPSKWRKALGIGRMTEGTHRLFSLFALEPGITAARAKAHETIRNEAEDSYRRKRIAAGQRRRWKRWRAERASALQSPNVHKLRADGEPT